MHDLQRCVAWIPPQCNSIQSLTRCHEAEAKSNTTTFHAAEARVCTDTCSCCSLAAAEPCAAELQSVHAGRGRAQLAREGVRRVSAERGAPRCRDRVRDAPHVRCASLPLGMRQLLGELRGLHAAYTEAARAALSVCCGGVGGGERVVVCVCRNTGV